MKTICLIYGYSARNAGDLAITLGAIDVLKSLGCQVKLFSRYKYQQNDYIESERYLRERYGNDLEIFESPFFLIVLLTFFISCALHEWCGCCLWLKK